MKVPPRLPAALPAELRAGLRLAETGAVAASAIPVRPPARLHLVAERVLVQRRILAGRMARRGIRARIGAGTSRRHPPDDASPRADDILQRIDA